MISYDNVALKIPQGSYREHYAKAIVELHQNLDCALTVDFKGENIA